MEFWLHSLRIIELWRKAHLRFELSLHGRSAAIHRWQTEGTDIPHGILQCWQVQTFFRDGEIAREVS